MSQRGLAWTNRVKFLRGGGLSDVGKTHALDVGKTKAVKAWRLLNLFRIFTFGLPCNLYIHPEFPPIGV